MRCGTKNYVEVDVIYLSYALDTAYTADAIKKANEAGILTIVGGPYIHVTYTAFLAPLLPRLIDNLSLSLTQAGSLSIFLQLAALFNVFIGYFADKITLHYLFLILANYLFF